MGSLCGAFEDAVAESFFSTLRLEVLDQHVWDSCDELASAIFEWIDCCFNATCRQTCCGRLSPVGCETTTAA